MRGNTDSCICILEKAIATGVCANLRKEDYSRKYIAGMDIPLPREQILIGLWRNSRKRKPDFVKVKAALCILRISVSGCWCSGVVGGGYNLAVGAALACKMQKRDNVSVVFFGDGASNRGTFHEAANMAAIWKLPVLFVCEMNCWASTTPYRTTTSVENISDRAAGYGMPGVIVDGNDVFEVYTAVKLAVERARRGGGPTLIEAKTYRIKGHFVGDPELYRTKEEVQKIFEETDPIKKFEKKAVKESLMTKKEMEDVRKKVERMIDESVEYARNSPYPEPSELFDDLYE